MLDIDLKNIMKIIGIESSSTDTILRPSFLEILIPTLPSIFIRFNTCK